MCLAGEGGGNAFFNRWRGVVGRFGVEFGFEGEDLTDAGKGLGR